MPTKRTRKTAEFFKSRVTQKAPNACPWLDAGKGGDNLNIEDFPTYILVRLSNTIRTHVTWKYLEPFSLTMPEWRLLALAARFSPLPFGEFAPLSLMDKGQVSRTLRTLRRKGLVRLAAVKAGRQAGARARPSGAAPRVEVFITPRGRTLCAKIVPLARKHQMRLLAMMSPQEMRTVYAVTRRLGVRLSQLEE